MTELFLILRNLQFSKTLFLKLRKFLIFHRNKVFRIYSNVFKVKNRMFVKINIILQKNEFSEQKLLKFGLPREENRRGLPSRKVIHFQIRHIIRIIKKQTHKAFLI